MSQAYQPTDEQAINQDETEVVEVKPSLDSVAVALTFSQTIHTFSQVAPSKLKWCDLTNTDMKRFSYYNIIEPADMNMGETTVWALAEWVENLLEQFNCTFNFSAKQIKELTDNADFFLTCDDSFAGSDAPVGNRKLGQLRRLNLLEFDEDNRNNHDLTTWQVSEKVDRLLSIHGEL